jgi:hypothetical protein
MPVPTILLKILGERPHTPTSLFSPSWVVFIEVLKVVTQRIFPLKVDYAVNGKDRKIRSQRASTYDELHDILPQQHG